VKQQQTPYYALHQTQPQPQIVGVRLAGDSDAATDFGQHAVAGPSPDDEGPDDDDDLGPDDEGRPERPD
jgi:hypothetical protein